jgi:hypothetical protein
VTSCPDKLLRPFQVINLCIKKSVQSYFFLLFICRLKKRREVRSVHNYFLPLLEHLIYCLFSYLFLSFFYDKTVFDLLAVQHPDAPFLQIAIQPAGSHNSRSKSVRLATSHPGHQLFSSWSADYQFSCWSAGYQLISSWSSVQQQLDSCQQVWSWYKLVFRWQVVISAPVG